mgnify:CR=1 FL=1
MARLIDLFKLPFIAFFKGAKKDFLSPFWWVFLVILVLYIPFLRPWWWIFFPLFISIELKKIYLWWISWDFAYPKEKWVMLEITPPKEVLIPIKAMEDVFSVMFSPLSDISNFREIWCEGELGETPYWMSFEIMSIEGELHFLARVSSRHRKILENTLYSHYPELEIHEVSDYAKNFPQNIPNEEWDLYGEDYILGREAPYPIKTYEKFFEPQGEKISAEEKRIDPINSLLESMSGLGAGEIYWLQIILMGAFEQDEPNFKKEGEAIVAKIAKRQVKKPKTFIEEIIDDIVGVIHVLIGGVPTAASQKTGAIEGAKSERGEREMVITPGEREIITEIEKKMSKPIFRTNIRGIYIARRDSWNSAHRYVARTYMSHFSTNNLNYLRFGLVTRTKVHDIFRKRRVFFRARRMLRNAFLRFPPLFPDRRGECALLTPEELATIFHFPIKVTGTTLSTMTRVESKKGGPPPNLPIE